jgi:transcription elongation factor GreA
MPDPITRRGYEKLQERLSHLTDVELPKQERALAEARERGDLSENSEYDAAREHIWEVERQIQELRRILMDVEPTDVPDAPNSVVFGTRVTLKNLTRGVEVSYEIVGKGENDIMLDRISWASPIAQAILGSRVGDTVEAEVPAGRMKFEILRIEPIRERD